MQNMPGGSFLASFTGRTCFEIFDMLGVAGAGPREGRPGTWEAA